MKNESRLQRKYEYEVATIESLAEAASRRRYGLLLAASWEPRSEDIVERIDFKMFKTVLVVRFGNQGKSDRPGTHLRNIKKRCRSSRVEFRSVEIDSVNGDTSYQHHKAIEVFSIMSKAAGGWLIDLTCIPRSLVAPLVMLEDRTNIIRDLWFHYSLPLYAAVSDVFDDRIFKFTEGAWRVREPAFSKIVWNAAFGGVNIISTGFEYESLKQVINQRAQDVNYFLITNPGVSDDYTNKAEEIATKISRVFEVNEDHFIRVGHGDFIGAKEKIVSLIDRLEGQHSQISLISAGGKLHGLAMVFSKLERPNVGLKIRMPLRYVENKTLGNGLFELIHVQNRYAPI